MARGKKLKLAGAGAIGLGAVLYTAAPVSPFWALLLLSGLVVFVIGRAQD